MTYDERDVYRLSTLSTTVFAQSPFLQPDVLDERIQQIRLACAQVERLSIFISLSPRYIFQPVCSA